MKIRQAKKVLKQKHPRRSTRKIAGLTVEKYNLRMNNRKSKCMFWDRYSMWCEWGPDKCTRHCKIFQKVKEYAK